MAGVSAQNRVKARKFMMQLRSQRLPKATAVVRLPFSS